jgi:ribonuclease D
VLQRSNIALANVFDTLVASRRIRGRLAGGDSLAAGCRRELDKVLDKTQQISGWTRRPLTNAQVAYAASRRKGSGSRYSKYLASPNSSSV